MLRLMLTVRPKATDFRFECFQGQSVHDLLILFRKWDVCKNSLGGDMHSYERLLVKLVLIDMFSIH